jgi:pheromone shutdown protein TraB
MTSDIDRVVFVAVIHTDTESVDHAKEIVREVRPDVVAVELDKSRYELLLNPPDDSELENLPPTSDISQDFMQQLALLQKGLGGMTGSEAGEEMMAAIEIGRELGAKIALVDRPIPETLQAIMRVPLDEIYRLTEQIPTFAKEGEGQTVQELFEMLKDSEEVESLMEQFDEEFPGLSDALVHQRNEYVARALHTILNDVTGRIVVVLGAGHIDGVRKALEKHLSMESAS